MRRHLLLVLILLLALPVVATVWADDGDEPPRSAALDVVVLKNGSVWRGRIVRNDAERVVLESRSESGGIARYTFPKEKVESIQRGRGGEAPRGGARPIRDTWFLLRAGGRIVGTRHLELWSVRTTKGPGFRLEEAVEYFAQGRKLPATRTKRVEIVDLKFLPLLLSYREVGAASSDPGGPGRYERNVSGKVEDGVWRAAVAGGGRTSRREVPVGEQVRGRLGLREHLLRSPRRVALVDATIIDPEVVGLVTVRAGFAAVGPEAPGRRQGHEFHWEEEGRRLISYFGDDTEPRIEEIAEGVEAVPGSQKQCEAARDEASRAPGDAATGEVKLAEAGIGFRLPDPLWTWDPAITNPANTGWRLLGRAENRLLLMDVRVEWHPLESDAARDASRVEAWLLQRLRGVCPDLQVTTQRTLLTAVPGAWRMGLNGAPRGEKLHTEAIVVDRPRGRVVLLIGCPARAYAADGRVALERIVATIKLL